MIILFKILFLTLTIMSASMVVRVINDSDEICYSSIVDVLIPAMFVIFFATIALICGYIVFFVKIII